MHEYVQGDGRNFDRIISVSRWPWFWHLRLNLLTSKLRVWWNLNLCGHNAWIHVSCLLIQSVAVDFPFYFIFFACTETRQFSWCQLCRHWRHQRLSLSSLTVSGVVVMPTSSAASKANLASCDNSTFSGHTILTTFWNGWLFTPCGITIDDRYWYIW